ncbi:MAG: Spy/CpxP family protein refolding chaperone [Terriglobales bacterium]
MSKSIVPQGSCFKRAERRSLVAAAVLAGLLSFGAGSALAQDQQGAAPPPASDQQSGQEMGRHMGRHQMPSVDDQVKHLTKKLNLSDDQQAKLKPILEDQRKQMDDLRNDSSLSREDRFSKMREIRQNSDTQIKSVLNDDQQKNFDKMRDEQHDRMKQWHKGGDSAPPAGGSPQQ